jgi:hypothetical protein
MILLISASHVARIIGVSHRHGLKVCFSTPAPWRALRGKLQVGDRLKASRVFLLSGISGQVNFTMRMTH